MSANVRPSASRAPLGSLERLTVTQVGVLLLFASWAFGGGAAWARQWIAVWGSLSLIILMLAVRQRALRGEALPLPVRWLWPFAGFNVLVLASCLNPSFSPMSYGREALIA